MENMCVHREMRRVACSTEYCLLYGFYNFGGVQTVTLRSTIPYIMTKWSDAI